MAQKMYLQNKSMPRPNYCQQSITEQKKKRLHKSQPSKKIILAKPIRKNRMLIRNNKKVKKEAQKQHLRKKNNAELDSGKRKSFIKKRILRQPFSKSKINKIGKDYNSRRKIQNRKDLKKRSLRGETSFRKKSRPASLKSNVQHAKMPPEKLKDTKADVTLKNNNQGQAEVIQKKVQGTTPDYETIMKYMENKTFFYEQKTPEEYKAYTKCQKTAPKIFGPWKKLHEDHMPEGVPDCRDERNKLKEKVLTISTKMTEEARSESWYKLQKSLVAERGLPKKCKQWRWGSDCV